MKSIKRIFCAVIMFIAFFAQNAAIAQATEAAFQARSEFIATKGQSINLLFKQKARIVDERAIFPLIVNDEYIGYKIYHREIENLYAKFVSHTDKSDSWIIEFSAYLGSTGEIGYFKIHSNGSDLQT